ncbi:MAG: hypothetical protein RLZZ176_1051 [Cyanobacteriota bacterium]
MTAGINNMFLLSGLRQNTSKVGVIHELPLGKNQVFDDFVRKS